MIHRIYLNPKKNSINILDSSNGTLVSLWHSVVSTGPASGEVWPRVPHSVNVLEFSSDGTVSHFVSTVSDSEELWSRVHSVNVLGSSDGTVSHTVPTVSDSEELWSRVHSVNVLGSSDGTVSHTVPTGSDSEELWSRGHSVNVIGSSDGTVSQMVFTGSSTGDFHRCSRSRATSKVALQT